MKKVFMFVFLLILISLALLNKNQNKVKNDQSLPEEVKSISLRLKWLDQAQFAGYYLAKSQGLYKNKGLEVTVNPGGPEIAPIQMVVSNVDQFGITGADQILLAREKGIPVVAVAVIYKNTPVAIGSLKGKNIRTPQDLLGKRMGMIYGRDEETIYRALLEKTKIDREKVKEVALLAGLSQLTSGKIDAQILYEINEPILLEQQGFEINLIKPRDYGVRFYADTLFTTEDMINNNSEMVRKFVQVSIEGWKQVFNDQGMAIDAVMAVNNSLNRAHQEKFLELSNPLITEGGKIGYSEEQTWVEMQKTLIDQGIMKKPVEINKVFTNDFLN